MTKHPQSMANPSPHLPRTIIILFKNSLISKLGWNRTKQLIKYLFEPQRSAFAEARTRNPLSPPISHHAPQYNQLGIEPYHAKNASRPTR